MARRLSDESLGEPISPLIDVVMNGFAAMFIILIIYIAMYHSDPAPPCPELEPLEMLDANPPPIIGGQRYLFALPVVGGFSGRSYRLVSGDVSTLGLSLDANAGVLHGTARSAAAHARNPDPGMYEVGFAVVDGSGNESHRAYRFEYHPVAVPYDGDPVRLLTQPGTLPVGREGSTYRAALAASGGVQPYAWAVARGRLPRGVVLDRSEGVLAGTPLESGDFVFVAMVRFSTGSYTYRGTRHDWEGGIDKREFSLRVLPRTNPYLILPDGRVGEEYRGAVVSELAEGERLVVEVDVPGLRSTRPTGALEGVPDKAGIYDIHFRVDGHSKESENRRARLRILPSDTEPAILSTTYFGRAGEALSVPVAYRGMVGPVEFRVASEDSSFEGKGTALVGRRREPGTEIVRVRGQDALGQEIDGAVEVHVSRPVLPLEVTVPESLTLVVGEDVLWCASTRGGQGDLSFKFDGALPAGTTGESNCIKGRLLRPGDWLVGLTVSDPHANKSVRRQFRIVGVHAERMQPSVEEFAPPVGQVGRGYDVRFPVTGGVGSTRLRFTGDAPTGVKFTETGLFGTPERPGEYDIYATVVDSVGQGSAPRRFTIEVVASEPRLEARSIPAARRGVLYEFTFPVRDGVEPIQLLVEGKLPDGIRVSGTTLRGSPSVSGEFPLRVRATDRFDQASKISDFRLVVLEAGTRDSVGSRRMKSLTRPKDMRAPEREVRNGSDPAP